MPRADAIAQAFSASCGMGYKTKEARAIVDALTHTVLATPALLFEALERAPVSRA